MMSTMVKARFFWGCLLLTALYGCVGTDPSEAAARERVEKFYEALQNRQFEQALSFYDKTFFVRQSPEDWRAYLEEVQTRLGRLKTTTLANVEVHTLFSGRQFMYTFDTTYDRGGATETLVLFKKIDQDGIRIVAHHIDSAAL